MMQPAPPTDQSEFAHVSPSRASPWKRIFRIARWTTYTFALVTLILLLHKAPPPLVETSPQAAARAEEKIEGVEKAVASGQTATLRMDETELNSYLDSHLALAGHDAPNPASPGPPPGTPRGDTPTPQEGGPTRPNARGVKVQLIDYRVTTVSVFAVTGKVIPLQFAGTL